MSPVLDFETWYAAFSALAAALGFTPDPEAQYQDYWLAGMTPEEAVETEMEGEW